MAPTWLETDTNTNVNISSATAVGVYTSTGDKFVMPQLLADQVAGSGDYVYYVTLQVNGAGTHFVMGPKTTQTAAAGETGVGAQGGFIAVRAGDVVTVYIDGLAGDTATPDVTVRWFELDASANVTYWAGVAAGAMPAKVADLPAAAPTAAAVADAVWDEAISGHLTSGTTGAKLNTAASGGASAGSTAYTNTVTDSLSAPLDGVEVWITSDSGGVSTVASTTTDTLGAFTVYLDPGTYYLWLAKGGYNFGNPTTITVT